MSGGCALAALTLLGGTAPARAASLRDSLGASADDRFVVPLVGRFRAGVGETFVVDRSSGRSVLMRFETNPEIWVLSPQAGPRGDVIYKNDVGEPVLRATRIGGLILFTPSYPGGAAAAFVGDAASLHPQPINTPAALLQSFSQASARAGRATGQQLILFEARDVPLAVASLFADAAQVTAEAFVRAAGIRAKVGRSVGRWTRVEFVSGRSPGATASEGTLRVTVTPERGLAGRPSSQRVAEVIVRAAERSGSR